MLSKLYALALCLLDQGINLSEQWIHLHTTLHESAYDRKSHSDIIHAISHTLSKTNAKGNPSIATYEGAIKLKAKAQIIP
ncbi:hypothetical protein OFD18_29645, partial [Escherichia coli]|nr:hypothetical protein [Escherichia coli]